MRRSVFNVAGSYEMYDRNVLKDTSAQREYLVGATNLSWNVFDGYKSIGSLSETVKTDHEPTTHGESEQYESTRDHVRSLQERHAS